MNGSQFDINQNGKNTSSSFSRPLEYGFPELPFLPRKGGLVLRAYWAALALMVGFLLVAYCSFSTMREGPVLGATTEEVSDGWSKVTWVMPGSYANEAGILPDDLIRPVSGLSDPDVRIALERNRAGNTNILYLHRRWGETLDYLLFTLGAEFLLLGLWVCLKANDRKAALRLFKLSLAFSITLAAIPAIGNGQPWALAIEMVGSKIGIVAFTLFFLTTPVERWPSFRRWVAVLIFPIIAFYAYTILGHSELYGVLKRIGYSYVLFSTTLSLVAMYLPLMDGIRSHRRFLPVAIASGFACLLFLIGSIGPYLIGNQSIMPIEVTVAGTALIPLSFFFVMVHYPLLGMSIGPWAVMRSMFDTISYAVFIVGMDESVVAASKAGLTMLKATSLPEASQRIGEFLRYMHEEKPTGSAQIVALFAKLKKGESFINVELALTLPDRSTIWLNLGGTPILNEHNEAEYFVFSCSDVTDRKQRDQERALLLAAEKTARVRAEELAAKNEAVLAQIADVVIISDPEGQATYLNLAAQRLLGFTDPQASTEYYWGKNGREITGKVRNLNGEPMPPPPVEAVRELRLPSEEIRNELRLLRPDDTEVVVHTTVTPIFTETGTCLGLVTTMRDVTERFEVERQKDEFLSNVSHDLRTPLTSIKFAIGAVLANEPPDIAPPIQTLLRNIDVSTDRMVSLVDDLLELSRLQAGRVQLHTSRCDLRELARRCIVAVEPLIQAKHQKLEMSLPHEPCQVEVDPRHIERAVINLISNANKYGREGGLIKIMVRRNGSEALLGVCDDGVGISPGELNNVFERFYRSNRSSITSRVGSGLGLPIARGLVELNGGRVWLESVVGQGSSAWVALPCVGIDREPSTGQPTEVVINRG